ncbi:MarR family protein [Methanobrevibacter cuticularis]|uniref:MarR family protein n=1 Tax=Methanobrevibacter cuticularis TaxID=47311 RepID=A0A166EM58_9EURY|nr:MarR family transcriptional regulator [Methanobrevibacter cuticularis]KZX16804.1 MarR family protein [Methanobrevibacter cuticularis]
MKIFKKRGAMTHFQILSEISKQEPHLRQKDIAERLGITVQAVSENIKSLIDDELITSKDGRSPYKITQKGIAKVKKDAITLRKYSDNVLETMNYYKSVWPAIAKEDLKKGVKVGLFMEDGILYASKTQQDACADVLCDAKKGEDVALTSLTGMIELEIGQVIIVTLPTINQGGSRKADFELIKNLYQSGFKKWGIEKIDKFGVMGTVARAVADKLDMPISIDLAVASSTISATKKGLNVLILAVGNMNKVLIKDLEDEDIKYNIVDAHK